MNQTSLVFHCVCPIRFLLQNWPLYSNRIIDVRATVQWLLASGHRKKSLIDCFFGSYITKDAYVTAVGIYSKHQSFLHNCNNKIRIIHLFPNFVSQKTGNYLIISFLMALDVDGNIVAVYNYNDTICHLFQKVFFIILCCFL